MKKSKIQPLSGLLAIIGFLALTFVPVSGFTQDAEKSANDEKKPVAAETATDQASEQDAVTEEAGRESVADKRKKILNEATSAIRETENALRLLDEAKSEDAIDALERATGKLEIILAREPSLALAPSSVSSITHNLVTDLEAVKALREEIEEALDEGRVQEARRAIQHLASETVVRVTNIPLATYPEAMKLAVSLIDDDKTEEAKFVLQTALNTLVITEVLIPLPIVSAEAMMFEAEVLAEKTERTESENEALEGLFDGARTELKIAQALGYGTDDDFENLFEQIEEIEEKTEGGKSGKGFFSKIKGFFDDTKESSQRGQSGEASESESEKPENKTE